MLMQEVTPEMLDAWKSVYAAYRPRLAPNRKPAGEIIAYLKGKYPLTELSGERGKQAVVDAVLSNTYYSEKLPAGKKPAAVLFLIRNTGAGKRLYGKQAAPFKGQAILTGIELETGFFHVEGSDELWDELFAFRGLDSSDLDNVCLVAEYVACLEKFDRLSEVLA